MTSDIDSWYQSDQNEGSLDLDLWPWPPEKDKVMTKPHVKYQGYRSSGSGQRLEKLFIGALKKEKENDNQYKLKNAMAIAIGLIITI